MFSVWHITSTPTFISAMVLQDTSMAHSNSLLKSRVIEDYSIGEVTSIRV